MCTSWLSTIQFGGKKWNKFTTTQKGSVFGHETFLYSHSIIIWSNANVQLGPIIVLILFMAEVRHLSTVHLSHAHARTRLSYLLPTMVESRRENDLSPVSSGSEDGQRWQSWPNFDPKFQPALAILPPQRFTTGPVLFSLQFPPKVTTMAKAKKFLICVTSLEDVSPSWDVSVCGPTYWNWHSEVWPVRQCSPVWQKANLATSVQACINFTHPMFV